MLDTLRFENKLFSEHPADTKVGQARKIFADRPDEDIFHIETRLDDPDLRCEPGDPLGAWAGNDPQLVDWILTTLRIGPSEIVHYEDEDMTVSTALTYRLELTRLSAGTVLAYAEAGAQVQLREFFAGLDADAQQDFINHHKLADLVEAYPAQIPAQRLVETLQKLQDAMASHRGIHNGQGRRILKELRRERRIWKDLY